MKILKTFLIAGLLLLMVNSCKSEKVKTQDANLILSASYKLGVIEPSGLSLDWSGEKLWTVSDENSTIYLISKKGELLDSTLVDGIDLEGVTIVDENTIAVVLERSRELFLLKRDGTKVKRRKFDFNGELNEGLEGVAFNSSNNHFYLLNEKAPRQLIELDEDLNVIVKTKLDWASDYSGICYEEDENVLWIISDESKMISKCNLEGSIITSFKIDLPQIEGIAVNMKDNKIYIVSDITAYLYVFDYNE